MSEYDLENWSLPAPVDGKTWGFCWTGREPATEEDLDALDAWMKDKGEYDVDVLTLVGANNREYTAQHYEAKGTPPEDRCGGLGSPVYETQKVGEGVAFLGSKHVWYWASDGVRDFGQVPNLSAYHRTTLGIHAGPRPGSEAEGLLANGFYEWDDENEYYVVGDPDA